MKKIIDVGNFLYQNKCATGGTSHDVGLSACYTVSILTDMPVVDACHGDGSTAWKSLLRRESTIPAGRAECFRPLSLRQPSNLRQYVFPALRLHRVRPEHHDKDMMRIKGMCQKCQGRN